MKLSTVFCLFAATLALAGPLTIRDEPAFNTSLIDSAGGSALPAIITEEVYTPPPTIPDTDDPMAPIPPSELSTRATPNRKLKWDFTWNLSAAAFTGTTLIELNSSGWVRFRTIFENKGFWTRKYAIACAVSDRTGRPYTLQRTSKVYGKLRIFQSNIKIVDESKDSADVSRYWRDIEKGNKKMECQVEIKSWFSLDGIHDLVRKVIDIIKNWGTVNGPGIPLF